ncbi:MAG TPA: ADP-ribosylglycohydrolase family protein [Anaerolineaceae bacterium]|nr:ADP-ribosylglycohydrolase family protein [Anaerolineaceae bacterium]
MSLEKAFLSLQGLSLGDAFGEQFFSQPVSMALRKELPPGPWRWTDDTHMALSIVETLQFYSHIDQGALAQSFARRYAGEPWRGYAGGAQRLLRQIGQGISWRQAAYALFNGGSYGNGGAMRAAPIGGFYAGNPERAATEADLSAEVTHAHLEGRAGAIAVAVAASLAAMDQHPTGAEFIQATLRYVPKSQVRQGLEMASHIPFDDFWQAVKELGTGQQVTAQDTVPFSVWCAASNLDDFEVALWQTVAAPGDVDTTCAMVGGIVALSTGVVPDHWLQCREPLPQGFTASDVHRV